MEEKQDSHTTLPENQPQLQKDNQSTLQVSKPSLKKSWTIIGLTLLILFLLGTTGFFAYQYYKPNLNKQEKKSAPIVTSSQTKATIDKKVLNESQPTPFNVGWNKYTNQRLGFSINFPEINTIYDGCKRGTDINKELKAYEDENQNIIYISPTETTIDHSQQLDDCEVIPTTVSTFSTYDQSMFANKYMKIIVNNKIKSEKDLEKFIQDEYGSACTIGNKTKTTNGNLSITINTHFSDDGPNPDCLVNYAYVILYNESHNAAITWITGQEPFFQIQNPTTKKWISDDYDKMVAESVVFF